MLPAQDASAARTDAAAIPTRWNASLHAAGARMSPLPVPFALDNTLIDWSGPQGLAIVGAALVLLVLLVLPWLSVRYIPNQQVGIVEKLWSRTGSVPEGTIIALNGEAGFQADLLRGGLHVGL